MSTILIIDDEDKYLELCKRHMPEHSFLEPARNYREAETTLARPSKKVDLVLLDVQLPDIEGFELCRRIRAEGPRKDTPVLFCTVRSSVAPVAEGLKAGATDYIIKPFETADLLSRVKAALSPGDGE